MASQKVAKNTNFSGGRWRLLLFLLAFSSAASIHLVNRTFLAAENPEALRENVSVITSDDASYLRPAINFIDRGEWKGSGASVGSYVLRSPGYGFLFACFYSLFGLEMGLWALLLFQFTIWAMAVSFIPIIAHHLGFKAKLAWGLGMLVALMPLFSSFLAYTLTEGITPALVIFFYSFLFVGLKDRKDFLLPSAILLGCIILVRPALILLVLSYIPLVPQLRRNIIPLLLVSLTPIFLWQLRVQRFTGRFDLHPIYHSDASTLYRPLHEAAWDFHKMTGQTGVEFHRSMALLWQAAQGDISKANATEAAVQNLHGTVIEVFTEDRLAAIYTEYITVLRQQIPFYHGNEPVGITLAGEEELIAKFETMKSDYVANNVIHAWIVVPASVAKELVFHSNLSLYLFQKPLRGNFSMEALRWLSLGIHLFIYVFTLIFLFRKKCQSTLAVAIPAVLFFLYLVFVQRGIEERYMLPYLVPMFLVASYTFASLLPSGVRRKLLRNKSL